VRIFGMDLGGLSLAFIIASRHILGPGRFIEKRAMKNYGNGSAWTNIEAAGNAWEMRDCAHSPVVDVG